VDAGAGCPAYWPEVALLAEAVDDVPFGMLK